MEVIEIVAEHLKLNGFTGLFNENDCACGIDDLAPCYYGIQAGCRAGHKHRHSKLPDFVVSASKEPMSDDDIETFISNM